MKLKGLDGAIRRLKCNKGGYKKQSGIDCRGAGNPKKVTKDPGSRAYPKTTAKVTVDIAFYCINTNEIPGELSRENLISSHVKIKCYLHM